LACACVVELAVDRGTVFEGGAGQEALEGACALLELPELRLSAAQFVLQLRDLGD
jgi:hypothetical protein